MRKIGTAVAAMAMVASTVALTATPVSASDTFQPQVELLNRNTITVNAAKPDEARVHLRYRCLGEGFHLWASVKQRMLDPQGGLTAANFESWYETPEGPAPTCDGQWHAQPVTVSIADGWDRLTSGDAYLQFVIFNFSPAGDFQRGATQGWHSVKVTGNG